VRYLDRWHVRLAICLLVALAQAASNGQTVKSFPYLLTDPRQFGILQSGPGWQGTEMQFDQKRRREFLTLLGGAATWPFAARAQQLERIRRIGILMGFAQSDPNARHLVAAFRSALATLGQIEGMDVRVEVRWPAGDTDRMRTFARELVELRPDVIVAQTTPVLRAVANETRTIPIVFTVVSDPIGMGLAAKLTRPGGNVTGFTDAQPAMGGKWVQLLKDMLPHTVSTALLFNPATAPSLKFYLPSIKDAASRLAIEVSEAPVHLRDEFEAIIAAQAQNPGGTVIVMPDGFNTTHRDLIIGLMAHHRVPAIYFNRYFAESGGLIGYGVEYANLFRLAAGYVERILRGEKPGELPIQLPSKFELAINIKTAKALGLTIPTMLIATADEVIE
jgi:putative ABC transport system substrate-binding protein